MLANLGDDFGEGFGHCVYDAPLGIEALRLLFRDDF